MGFLQSHVALIRVKVSMLATTLMTDQVRQSLVAILKHISALQPNHYAQYSLDGFS